MLKAICRVPCWAGLQAGFQLQLTLARWLCQPGTAAASINEQQIKALHPDEAVQDWLWTFLRPRVDQTRLMDAAARIASHTSAEKTRLLGWLNVASDVPAQFQATPLPWPTPPEDLPHWPAFVELMKAFYERLDTKGVPFDATGAPTADAGVTYRLFLDEFKAAHSDRVCVVCGDHLGKPQVDHWIWKANYPVLSITPDNLLPMCHECNEPPGKGQKPVFSLGVPEAFRDWFHPHYRSGYGSVRPQYDPLKSGLVAAPTNPADATRVANLDNLVGLSERWTSEFKAEYRSKQKEMKQLVSAGRLHLNRYAIDTELQRSLDGLVDSRPNYHVHQALFETMRQPAHLDMWLTELS